MKILLNSRETSIDGESSINISELFRIQKFTFPHIIVKVNGQLIKKESYNETFLNEGDKVEAIHLIGGG